MEDFQSKELASDDNGTPEDLWQYGGLSEYWHRTTTVPQKPFGNMEDFQSKVLASDGVVENPQNKDQLPERAK